MKVRDRDSGKSNSMPPPFYLQPPFCLTECHRACRVGWHGDPNDGSSLLGRDTPPPTCTFFCSPSLLQNPFNPNEDNLTDHAGFMKSHDGQNSSYVDAPSIQVCSEFPTITRTTDPTQPLTCIVAIELLGKRPPGSAPALWLAKTFPVVKYTMLDSQTSSVPGSPHPNTPPPPAYNRKKLSPI